MNKYLISSTKKSSGKTILSIGLSAILSNQKLAVFKKGPDYIDPLWISKAAKKPCYNLDFNTMASSDIKDLYMEKSHKSNISIIEGNKGLFDGVSLDGKDSNAALSKLLSLEVILLIDCIGITRGIAPLINGYRDFDKKIKYKGIVLNNIKSERHESKILNAINEYSDFDVLGSIYNNNDLAITEQHQGLVPEFSSRRSDKIIQKIKKIIKSSVDTDSLLNKQELKKNFIKTLSKKGLSQSNIYSNINIGIIRDEAFGFYYPDDIEKFKSYGVKIKWIDSIRDKSLPNIDALFLGGGFPELNSSKLSKNKKFIKSIKLFIEKNQPIYAECGGLMYLCNSISINNKSHQMTGIIDADIKMNKKPIGRGYVNLSVTKHHPWLRNSKIINAHEFHYSSIKFNKKRYKYGFKVTRGYGVNGKSDGILYKNLVACYSHLRSTKQSNWIEQFLKYVNNIKNHEAKTDI